MQIFEDIARLDRIVGPTALALRRHDSRLWTVVPARRIPDGSLPLGLQFQLAKTDAQRAADPAVTAAGPAWAQRLALPAIPIWIIWTMLCLLAAAALANQAQSAVWHNSRPPLVHGTDLLLAFASVAITWFLLVFCAARAVTQHLNATVPILLLAPWPRLEPVVWRLGIPPGTTLQIFGFALPLIIAGLGFWQVSPPVALGTITAGTFYLIVAAYPLWPTPGARLLGSALGLSDVSQQLSWTLLSRFLLLRSADQGATRWVVIAASSILPIWLVLFGTTLWLIVFQPLAEHPLIHLGWQTAVILTAGVYAVRLAIELLRLVIAGLRIRRGVLLEAVTPPDEMVQRWRSQSALIRHVPALLDADWQWNIIHAGSYLIRYGATDRRFYWLTSGRVVVLARDTSTAPRHVATLGAGTGVGEVALLENRTRTADVVVEETALVTSLTYEAFDKVAGEDVRRRFREVVHASQSLGRATVFFGMPDPDRERWTAYGSPRHFDPGDAIMLEGSTQQWMGLLVEGRIAVERGDDTVAELEADSVFGEIAYLTGGPRTATLRALEPTLVWRWDKDWLDAELARAGIGEALQHLAQRRLEQK